MANYDSDDDVGMEFFLRTDTEVDELMTQLQEETDKGNLGADFDNFLQLLTDGIDIPEEEVPIRQPALDYVQSCLTQPRILKWFSTLQEDTVEKYKKMLVLFFSYRVQHGVDKDSLIDLRDLVDKYLNVLHDGGVAATSIWSHYSVVNSYLRLTYGINIMANSPENKRMLHQWAKKEVVKKAKVFKKEEIERYLRDAPNDEKHIHLKVALILGVHGLLRCKELKDTLLKHVTRNGLFYEGTVKRRKQNGPPRWYSYYVTDPLAVSVLDKFFSADMSDNTDPEQQLLRRVTEHEKYTGHCMRRTGATLLMDSGATLLQLKEGGGWASDRIAESYIAQSVPTKHAIANAFSTATTTSMIQESTTTMMEDSTKSSGKKSAGLPNPSPVQDPSPVVHHHYQIDLSNNSGNHTTICLMAPQSMAQNLQPMPPPKEQLPPPAEDTLYTSQSEDRIHMDAASPLHLSQNFASKHQT